MKIIIATHGRMASGVKSSVELLMGQQPHVYALDAYLEDSKPVGEQLAGILTDPAETVIVFTDIVGGSVNREAMMALRGRNAYIIPDFNLAMVLEILCMQEKDLDRQTINDALALCSEKMRCIYMKEV